MTKDIERFIMDGQWYTVNKLSSQSNTTEKEVLDWLKKNINILAEKTVDGVTSYRVQDANVIIQWYEDNGYSLDENLDKNNYPTKIWKGKTEAQWYIDIPRVRTDCLIFTDLGSRDIDLVKSTLMHKGIIMYLYKKIYFFCIDLDGIDLTPISHIKYIRKVKVKKRLYTAFPPINEFVLFYIKFLQQNLSQLFRSIRFDLPPENIEYQLYEWCILALTKYSEKSTVPFPVYLLSCVRMWVYDLSPAKYGTKMAKFQKQMNQITQSGRLDKNVYDYFSDEYTEDEFINLFEYYRTIHKIKFTNELIKNENNEEYISDTRDVIPQVTEKQTKFWRDLIDISLEYKDPGMFMEMLKNLNTPEKVTLSQEQKDRLLPILLRQQNQNE